MRLPVKLGATGSYDEAGILAIDMGDKDGNRAWVGLPTSEFLFREGLGWTVNVTAGTITPTQ